LIAGLVLASGASRRFGGNKLLASLGEHAVVHWAAAALSGTVDELLVVVAEDTDDMREALAGLPVRVVVNDAADQGLSSSIRAGVSALPPEAEAVVITLGDQPLLERECVARVIVRWQEGGVAAVATRYADGRGHPVLFSSALFPVLRRLEGDRGARAVLDGLGPAVALVEMEAEQPIDVDTREALEQVRSQLERRARDAR